MISVSFIPCPSFLLTLDPCLDAQRSKKRRSSKRKNASPFSSADVLDALLDIPISNSEQQLSAPGLIPANDMSRWSLPEKPRVPTPIAVKQKELPRLMPAWDKDFWRVYGNKIRVNGTIEGICDLSLVIGGAHCVNGVTGIQIGHEIAQKN